MLGQGGPLSIMDRKPDEGKNKPEEVDGKKKKKVKGKGGKLDTDTPKRVVPETVMQKIGKLAKACVKEASTARAYGQEIKQQNVSENLVADLLKHCTDLESQYEKLCKLMKDRVTQSQLQVVTDVAACIGTLLQPPSLFLICPVPHKCPCSVSAMPWRCFAKEAPDPNNEDVFAEESLPLRPPNQNSTHATLL
jgi:hypothetical protein